MEGAVLSGKLAARAIAEVGLHLMSVPLNFTSLWQRYQAPGGGRGML